MQLGHISIVKILLAKDIPTPDASTALRYDPGKLSSWKKHRNTLTWSIENQRVDAVRVTYDKGIWRTYVKC